MAGLRRHAPAVRIDALRRVGEVVAVTALSHLAFRAWLHGAPLGAVELEAGELWSPAVAWLLAGLLAIASIGGRGHDWGFAVERFDAQLRDVALALAALAGTAAVLLAFGVELRPRFASSAEQAVAAFAALAALAITVIALPTPNRRPSRITAVSCALLAVAVLVAPFVRALLREAPLESVASPFFRNVILAAVAEELFFRGYVQSRVDTACGTPWRLRGVEFGLGWFAAAALFGIVHALNPFDYFTASGHVEPWRAVSTALMPYGWLRARAGSIAGPVLLHALVNALALAM